MAKLCVMCGCLCAYFLIFLANSALCSIDDHYYETDGVPKDRVEVFFNENVRIKRDVQIESNQSNTNSSGTIKSNGTTTKTQEIIKNNGTLGNQTEADNKMSTAKSKLGKSKVALTPNATKPTIENVKKNLGVNGTGIRKLIPTLKPVLLNQTTKAPVLQNITLTPEESTTGDLDIDSFPPDEDSESFNKTLAEHHITNSTEDSHQYYNSTIRTDPEVRHLYWVDLKNNTKAKVNDLLSNSHRRAATVQLSFEFPFYGHPIKNVTIATGGFLYTGDYVHSWLAATQYIAPLMANFDTSISNDSNIRYYDNGSAFTVEWENVALQDRSGEGEFTFQTTLYKSGDIVFVYKNIPLFIKNITDDHHPVKVGLSDAYIIDRTIFLVRRKTIYEYHRINFVKEDITNGTVIYLTALPTCLQNQDCLSCVTKVVPGFQCYWCPTVKRCSNGIDRFRQDWITNRCQNKHVNESDCAHVSGSDIFDDSNITYVHDANAFQQIQGVGEQPVRMGVSSIMAILFLIAMVAGLGVWVLYAYRNPHTTSGQILIRYRPSQWRWRRGEARYTAATIHM